MNDKGGHKAVAKAAGLTRYNTGRACSSGHLSDRSVANGTCCECARLRAAGAYAGLGPEEKQEYLAGRRAYNKGNLELFRAYAKRTNAQRRQRTPPWSETKEILQFYKSCPAEMHVDHIVPLKGKLVSGLHVINNLQYLTKAKNLAKGNSFNQELF